MDAKLNTSGFDLFFFFLVLFIFQYYYYPKIPIQHNSRNINKFKKGRPAVNLAEVQT